MNIATLISWHDLQARLCENELAAINPSSDEITQEQLQIAERMRMHLATVELFKKLDGKVQKAMWDIDKMLLIGKTHGKRVKLVNDYISTVLGMNSDEEPEEEAVKRANRLKESME